MPSLSVPGTKLVVFVGGPPEWDGRIDAISKTGCGTAERWCHTADLAVLYRGTDRVQEVEVERELRGGPKIEKREAQVYEYLGYKEDVNGV